MPGAAQPGGTDPSGADPGGADPGGAGPGGADPSGADPSGADPGGADPGGAGRDGSRPNDTGGDAARGGAGSNGAWPGGTGPYGARLNGAGGEGPYGRGDDPLDPPPWVRPGDGTRGAGAYGRDTTDTDGRRQAEHGAAGGERAGTGGDGAADDEVLPPAGQPRGTGELTVARLQPANVRHTPPAKPGPAGKPPGAATAASVLCGVLAVPMLAAAGALFAGGAHPAVAASTLVMAILSVLGGVRLIRRGSPLLPLVCAAFAVLGGILLMSGAAGSGVLTVVLGTVWLVFTVLALIMVVLLRRRRVRRWLTARGREWQRSRPAPRRWRWRRRIAVPATPRLRQALGRFRPPRRPTRQRRPARVKQVGRHVRGRRRGPRSGRPVGFVGRDAPSQPPRD